MKLISWNVNGLRACLTHGFCRQLLPRWTPIFFSVQETKMQPGQADFCPGGLHRIYILGREKGLLRHGLLVQAGAAGRDHRHRAGGA